MKTLKLNKDIFSLETINAAISDYAQLAEIKFAERNHYVLLTFLNCKYDKEFTIKEFKNYLIGLENTKC